MQKARRHPGEPGLRPLVSVWFQALFTPLLAVLFTFPSQYLFAIGLPVVFSLTGWCRWIQAGFLRSRRTQGTRPVDKLACTGLSPAMAALSRRVPLALSTFLQALQPPEACLGVWANPLSLATTRGITIVFSSSGYLDVSVPRVVPLSGPRSSTGGVSPFGHLRITGRLHRPAAFRSLPRPSSSLGAKASPIRP